MEENNTPQHVLVEHIINISDAFNAGFGFTLGVFICTLLISIVGFLFWGLFILLVAH
ncbi:hypothetical protein H9L19_04845 [Weissella diestrammenae]|uniref:Uncharacterized protein n=1 Tax=Weissella diestrammenae TaxID=1162633 RepID=A0A7G9T3S5_9LACO|nr:hypothetical protein [Weissella diestrammenae]MCM0582733.1 hypothetical protein [Weissella diestrammenae]QNN74750.1 hypothetical protein H9L19_04845 [Weissella diestrammenae]